MSSFVPARVSLPAGEPDAPRIGDLLGTRVGEKRPPKLVLIGFPSDEGTRRRGGRVGLSGGPGAIRGQFYRLKADGQNQRFRDLIERTQDLGDLVISGDVEQDQELLGAVLTPYLKGNILPIILGGGSDAAYGHFLGYVNARHNASVLRWSPTPGVESLRQGLAHSGSAFRQILQHPSQSCRLYTVVGLQPQEVSGVHLDFISNRNGRYVWRRSLGEQQAEDLFSNVEGRLMVSLDLSALDQVHAPGVSRPVCDGLPLSVWLQAAQVAGRSPSLSSLELVGLNPLNDRDEMTARLAALTLWRVFSGLADRF